MESKFKRMNRFLLLAGLISAISTPLGVHIGFLMASNKWIIFIIEIILLTILHLIAPIIWVRAQTIDIGDRYSTRNTDSTGRGNYERI